MVDVYNTCSYFVRERSYLHRLATYGDIRNRTKLCESRGSKGDGSQGVARIEGEKIKGDETFDDCSVSQGEVTGSASIQNGSCDKPRDGVFISVGYCKK